MKHFHSALFLGCLGAAAVLQAQQQQPPSPTLSALLPNAVLAGSPGFSMRVEGSRFTQNSRVVWRAGSLGATNLATTFVSESTLTAQVPASLVEQAGQYAVTVTQPGDFGVTLSSGDAQFLVVPGVTISTSCPLPGAIVNRPYEAQLTPSGGLAPYTWSLDGALPSGLAFTRGTIAGTPTQSGNFSFTVSVTDNQRSVATKACSLRVVASSEGQTIFITQLDPPGVIAGSAGLELRLRGDGYKSGDVVVWNSGGAGAVDLPTRWAGDPRFLYTTLPASLLTAPGSFSIVVRAVVLTRTTFSNPENFVVAAPVQVSTPCPLRDASLRVPYTTQLTAAGGFAPYTFGVAPGSLPPGLGLRPTGELTGTPTEAGVYDLSITAIDDRGNASTRACSLRVLGPLSAAPASLTFSADAAGIPAAPQLLAVSGSASGLPFSVQAAVETGVSWLRVTTDTSRMPALVKVVAEPGTLGPGVYRGSVTVSTEAATNRLVSIPVTLIVGNVRNSEIVPRPLALRFGAGRISGPLQWQSIQLLNTGSRALAFTVRASEPWLTAAATAGPVTNNQPGLVRVRASADGLAPGTYRASVRITGTEFPEVVIPVSLSVGLAPETLVVAQSGFSFTAVQGGSTPAQRPVNVLSNGTAGYFWEASTGTATVRPFLLVDPTSNASRPGSPSAVNVRPDLESLAPGIHYGDVRITSSNADNSPRLVSAALEILPPTATPFPELSFSGLLLTAPAGSATTTAQGLLVRNISRTPMVVDYQLAGDSQIFTATASAARTLGPGESRRIEVQANASALTAGVRKAVLYIQSSADPQVRAVNVTLLVTPAAGASCMPSNLVVSPASLADGFEVTGGLPTALEFRVLDDCGQPLNDGLFAVVPSNASGVAQLVPAGDGRWAGTWPVLQNTASAVALTYNVEDPSRNLRGSGTISGLIRASSVPVIGEDAALSAASFARGAPLAPGSLFAIFGSQLAQGQLPARNLPLPFFLGPTHATMSERELPLFYAGDQGTFSQVNAAVPYDAPVNTIQQVAVYRNGLRSPYADLAIATAQPAIFVVVPADPTVPVTPGKAIVIYCEGLGAVNSALLAGQESPGNPLATVRNPVTVTIGGVSASVLFAGLTPGLSGLYQVNAVVPEGAPIGPAVPVVITSAGLSSEPKPVALN